jgi:hypothetical protein
MGRFAAWFAGDVDFVNVCGWWWQGRGEIEQRHALVHKTISSESLEIVCSHNTDTMEVPPTHPLAGDKT